MKKMRTLMLALSLALIASFVLTGCGAKETSAPAASATAKECPPAPTVDKDALLKDGMKAAAVNYFSPLPSDSNNIKAPDVQKMIDAKTDFFGVDLRANADYVKGHLPGFVNIPFAEVGKNLDKFPKDKLIIMQCYTGQTASQAVGVLRTLGYNAKNLHFGFQGVTDNKLSLVQ